VSNASAQATAPLTHFSGAMIAMSPTMTLRGTVKFSVKKMIAGADLNTSSYIGPGELLLAPPMLGDITSIRLSGNESWSVGHDAYLASTQGVIKDHKRQGLGKAMFSGEGLFVYKMSGTGIMWLTSFGAIIRKDVSDACPPLSAQQSLIKGTAAHRRRKIYRRQRPPRGMEHKICSRARRFRRNNIELCLG